MWLPYLSIPGLARLSTDYPLFSLPLGPVPLYDLRGRESRGSQGVGARARNLMISGKFIDR